MCKHFGLECRVSASRAAHAQQSANSVQWWVRFYGHVSCLLISAVNWKSQQTIMENQFFCFFFLFDWGTYELFKKHFAKCNCIDGDNSKSCIFNKLHLVVWRLAENWICISLAAYSVDCFWPNSMHGLKDEWDFLFTFYKNGTHTRTPTHTQRSVESEWQKQKIGLLESKIHLPEESFASYMSHCMLVLCSGACPCPGPWVRVCVCCHDWCPVCARFRLNAFDKSVSTKRRMTERSPTAAVGHSCCGCGHVLLWACCRRGKILMTKTLERQLFSTRWPRRPCHRSSRRHKRQALNFVFLADSHFALLALSSMCFCRQKKRTVVQNAYTLSPCSPILSVN